MKKIASAIVLAGLVMAPVCFAEARCCGRRTVVVRKVVRPCPGNVSVCRAGGKCKKYSWTGRIPEWKRLPDDCQFLPDEEYERFKEAMELIPEKVRKQAAKKKSSSALNISSVQMQNGTAMNLWPSLPGVRCVGEGGFRMNMY